MFSTREFYQRFLARKVDVYRVKHIYFFKRKIIILKGLLKIAFFARKSVLKTSTGNAEYENFNITTFYRYVKMN